MSIFSKLGALIFAPTDAAGNPRQVNNHDAQVWSTEVERAIYYAMVSGNLAYATKADLDADLAHDDGTVAWVVADTEALNGIYVKSGASGSGSWAKERNLPTGPQGDIGGVAYRFDDGTADADPGTGLIRANNADLSVATELYVSKSNRYGDDLSGFLATLAGSTSTHKGYLVLTAPDSETQAAFTVTGVTDAAGYVKLAVSGQGGATAFSDAERLIFLFSRTGNAGDLNGVNPGTTGLAVLGAETVGDVAGIIGNFASRSDAVASSLRVAPDYIRTAGYAALGDGGGALYKKVASEPSHEGKFPITLDDGVTVVWYELAPDNLNFRQFGVHPDNTAAENRAALQDGVDYAGALAAANDAPQEIKLPAGRYLWGNGAYDAIADWRHIVFVPDNVVIGGTGTLVSSTHFSNRSVGFVVRGDNVIVQDVSFLDTYTATSNWIIPVGAGTSYDSGLTSGRTYENLVVRRCTFNNAWLSASVQFADTDDGTISWDGVTFVECTSKARPGAASAGNFNLRSEPPGKIKNGRMFLNVAEDGKTASAFNFVGVHGLMAIGNESHRNLYAHTECENGCQDGVVHAVRSYDDAIGLWIDDSRRITWSGIDMRTESESVSTPLHGTMSRIRPALYITREGFDGDSSYVTTDIIGGGIIGEFNSIKIGTFGASPAGGFGAIVIDGFSLRADGAARSSGNYLIDAGGEIGDLTLANGRVIGAPSRALSISAGAVDSVVRLKNVVTSKVGAESSDGLVTSGAGEFSLEDCDFHSHTFYHTGGTEAINWQSGDVRQSDIRAGQRIFYGVSGSPEGVLSAAAGSIAHSSDGNVYRKSSASGNTGWVSM